MRKKFVGGVITLVLSIVATQVWAKNEITLVFENEDLQTVIKKVGEFTGTTFLFDPEQVKGKITLLAPRKVPPEEALKLLQSALALHGYTVVKREEGAWIMPAEKAPQGETLIKVVPLQYAKAEEVAYAFAWIAPPGVRIVPYPPTNSLLISGDPIAVEEMVSVLKGQKKEAEGVGGEVR